MHNNAPLFYKCVLSKNTNCINGFHQSKKRALRGSPFFFENNWKLYRDSAMKSGAIKSYKLLRNNTDSSKADIILMTEYFDKDSYLKREEIFRPIMKSIHPNGGVLKNNLKRDDILTIDSNMLTEVLW